MRLLWKNLLTVKAIIGIGAIVYALILTPMETNTEVSGRMENIMVKVLLLLLTEVMFKENYYD